MNTEDKEEAKLIGNKVPADSKKSKLLKTQGIGMMMTTMMKMMRKRLEFNQLMYLRRPNIRGLNLRDLPRETNRERFLLMMVSSQGISLTLIESEFIITKKDSPDKLQQNSAAYGGNQRQYNNRNQNEEGGQRGDFKKPFTKKFDPSQIDLQSNYRLYYEKDLQFYSDVIESEDPGEYGYQFKIMLNLTPEIAESPTK